MSEGRIKFLIIRIQQTLAEGCLPKYQHQLFSVQALILAAS